MKNHEENFDELHKENEDADLAGAYNSAIAVPDLWDRISAGFDAELENIKNEKLGQGNVKVNNGKQQYGADILTGISGDNKNYKRFAHYKGWMGLAAAVLLVCIIAIPLIRSGIMRNRKTDIAHEALVDESYAESFDDEMAEAPYNDAAETAESYDNEVAEAYDDEMAGESYDAATNKAAGAYDSAVQDSESEDTDGAATNAAVASEYAETAADETASDFEVEVSGSITRSGDEYILTVTAVLNTVNSDYAISENDSINLTGAKLNLKDGETVTYESIRLNNLEPITEEDVANTGYKISYTAEVVLLR
jgi:uncharacterized protein (DUF2132 family)